MNTISFKLFAAFSKSIFFLLCFTLVSHSIHAQDSVTDSIKVYGNCNMCKTKIEGALKKNDGILSKNWDKETKIFAVTYNPTKITLQQIGEKVAGAGYDNQFATAKDDDYNKLHSCCQYERPQQSYEEKESK